MEVHLTKELGIKDELERRQSQYIKALQDELKMATKIIKYPRLKDEVCKNMNYDRIYYY